MSPAKWMTVNGAGAASLVAATIIANNHAILEPATILPVLVAGTAYGLLYLLTQRKCAAFGLSPARAAFAFLAGLFPMTVNLPYIWYRSASSSVSDVDFLSNNVTIAAEILLGAALVAVLLGTLSREEPRLLAWASNHPWRVIIPLAGSWFVIGSALSIAMHYFMHEPGPNTTMVVQALDNVFDSRGPLYAGVLQAEGSSILGVHTNFIYFLIYPLYRLVPRYETVLILAQLAMIAAVFPLYKLSRTVVSKELSLLVVLLFLTNPTIAGSAAVQDMSELRFLALPLFASLYFFLKNRYLPFSAFSILAVLLREDVAILYLLLGVYAFFTHRSWKWSVVPVVLGVAWFAVMTNLVIPAANPAGRFTRLEVVYEEYGGTQTDLIKYLILHPWFIVKRIFANPSTFGLTFGLWQTTGLGLPLVSGLAVLAIPGLAELLILESGGRPSINSHHAIIIAVPLLAALPLALARLRIWASRIKSIPQDQTVLVAAIIILFASISAFHIWFNPSRYTPRYNYDDAREMLSLVPGDAGVVLPMYMLIHAGGSRDPIGYYQIAYREDLDLEILQEDYVIIDMDVPAGLEDLRLYRGLAILRDSIESSGDYQLVREADDLQLYVRTGHDTEAGNREDT